MSFTSLPRPTIGSASSPPTFSPNATSWASVHNVTLPVGGATRDQKGLTTPVRLGIPIVGVIVGIVLVGLAVWLFTRYRQRKTRAHRKDTTDSATGLQQSHGATSDNRDHVEAQDNKHKQAHMFELAGEEKNRHVPVGGAVVNTEISGPMAAEYGGRDLPGRNGPEVRGRISRGKKVGA
ncbi:hypothetical protein V8F33_012373 [Rhypophila sp. PSN 637]